LLSDESETTRAFAASTLSSIGTPALPSLQQNIETGQGIGRRLAAETMVAIRPSRRTAAPLLRKLLSDEDPASRAKAMELMATVHVNDSESFIAISNRLHDTNPGVRQTATNILLKLRNEGTYPTATSNP
jgi:HEAT repeat protein